MDTNASAVVFRVVLVITATLAVLLLGVLPFQESGSAARYVTLGTLVLQAVLIAVAAAGLYFGWEPFEFLEEA